MTADQFNAVLKKLGFGSEHHRSNGQRIRREAPARRAQRAALGVRPVAGAMAALLKLKPKTDLKIQRARHAGGPFCFGATAIRANFFSAASIALSC
ncbi:hypothetical protein Q3C01_39850 [Bradyrhizobium sp. UFLA05-109]